VISSSVVREAESESVVHLMTKLLKYPIDINQFFAQVPLTYGDIYQNFAQVPFTYSDLSLYHGSSIRPTHDGIFHSKYSGSRQDLEGRG
jgi:hypothetical protein